MYKCVRVHVVKGPCLGLDEIETKRKRDDDEVVENTVKRLCIGLKENEETPNDEDIDLYSLGNQLFNNALVLKKIFSFFAAPQPLLSYRLINTSTDEIISNIMRKRGNVSLRFGEDTGAERFQGNKGIITKFHVPNAVVSLATPREDVMWLAANHANKLKYLSLDLNVTNNLSLQVLQYLLTNLKCLEELSIAPFVLQELFDQLDFKLETIKKIRIFYDYDMDGPFDWSLSQSRKFREALPNVEDLSTGRRISCYFLGPRSDGMWTKLKSISLKLADKNELEGRPFHPVAFENAIMLYLLSLIPQDLESIHLTGAITVGSLVEALRRHAKTLKLLTMVVDMKENERFESFLRFPILQELKELVVCGRFKHYVLQVTLPNIMMLNDQENVEPYWWPNVFPKLEKLRIDLPIFEDFDNVLASLLPLPNDPEELARIPPNETLKTLEVRIPTTNEGDVWAEKLVRNFPTIFPNALLTLTKY